MNIIVKIILTDERCCKSNTLRFEFKKLMSFAKHTVCIENFYEEFHLTLKQLGALNHLCPVYFGQLL